MAVKLYTPPRLPGLSSLLIRIGIVLALLATSTFIVYFEGGLIDSHTGKHPDFLDCVYFVLITITTVGYGDKYPVTWEGQLVAAILISAGVVTVILLGAPMPCVFSQVAIDSMVSTGEAGGVDIQAGSGPCFLCAVYCPGVGQRIVFLVNCLGGSRDHLAGKYFILVQSEVHCGRSIRPAVDGNREFTGGGHVVHVSDCYFNCMVSDIPSGSTEFEFRTVVGYGGSVDCPGISQGIAIGVGSLGCEDNG